LQKPFAFEFGGPMTLRDLSQRIDRGLGAWHMIQGLGLEKLILSMLSQSKSKRPRIDQVIRFPLIARAVAGFIRDLASGKFKLKVDRAELLIDQVSALGLRGLCATALHLGVAQRKVGSGNDNDEKKKSHSYR